MVPKFCDFCCIKQGIHASPAREKSDTLHRLSSADGTTHEQVVLLVTDYVLPLSCWHYYHFVFFLCHVLAMSSNCYNPFLYGWLNDAFRLVLDQFHKSRSCDLQIFIRNGFKYL